MPSPKQPQDDRAPGVIFSPRPRADPVVQTLSAAAAELDEVVSHADAAVLAIGATVAELLRPLLGAADRVVAAVSAEDRERCHEGLEELKALGDALAADFAQLEESLAAIQRAVADRLDAERARVRTSITSRWR